MSIRKIFSHIPAFLAMLLFLPGICFSSTSEITSISQLNDPRYRVGSDSDGPVLERARENFPNAQILKYNDFLSEYLALQSGKIDALTANESEFISAVNNGLEHVRILPGYVGKPVPTAAGLSDRSEIPGLKEKFNAFIAGLKADGTLSAMYKRWVYDNDTNMPAIDVPENSDIHLTVATTGVVMPFSFFINSDVTGFDIELGRRFAAYLGATVEFKIYGFGSILMAIKSGAVDIALSNLYVTKESAESVTFSDVVFDINCIAAVYDENKTPAIPKNETGNFEAFRGKRIGVPVGSVISEMVKERIPDAEIYYFDMLANFIAALESRKIDAFAMDEPIIYMLERENNRYTHSDKNLGSVNNAFIFSKSPENNPLADEINEYILRMRSDGTLDEIRAIWFGGDEGRKIIPDYKNFPGTKGTIRIATNNDTPPFSYIKDGRLAGYDVDVILRFCRDKGYRPDFSEMNFSSVIPAVSSRKCDIGIGAISMTEERADSVRFSEPVCSVKTLMLILKSSELNQTSQKQDSQNTYASRKPKYTTLAELDGKPIGVQTGVFEWADFVEKTMPHSQIVYFNTFADIAAALKTHKIEAFLVDEPVYNLMAAEDKNLARIDAKIDDTYDIAYGFPKNSKGKKLCDEMSEYIRKLKASGELDAITAKWEGNDEAAKTIPDYKHFPAHNGVLTMATEGEYPPFNYYRGNEIAGLEIDIAARFCESYGYGLDVASMAWDSIISAVVSGKFDFAGAYLDPAEAHTDNMYFSQPYVHGRSVIACLKAEDSLPTAVSKKNEPTPKYKSFSELDGKTIGMQPGIIEWEEWAAKNLPHSKILYYNTYPDLVAALKTHKIEGLLIDFPVLALMAAEDNTLAYIDEPVGKPFGYSFFCAQTEAGKKLCDEMSEYIRKIKASGELDAILSKWQGADESAKIPPDFKSLPAKNGTLTYAAEGSYPPFSYYKGTKLAGIDIDIAAGFCREYGYGLGVQMMLFDATIPAINSGKVDFAGDFTPSEEHEEAVYFSEPYCNARSVIACLRDESQNVSTPSANLAGKIIGVQTGTTCAELVPEKIPSAKLSYYDSLTDEITALKAGKVDAICCSLPAAIFAENEDSRLTRINPPLRETYLYPIFARTEKGKKLCDEYSEFLKGLWDDGTIDALNAKWLGKDEGKKTLDDYSQLPSTNGTMKMAVDASMIPFAYVRDNKIVGYDIELAVRFCRAKGYSLEVENMTFTGVIASVKTGKCDFTQSMNQTPERAENTLFTSTPAIKSGNVLLTMKTHESPYTVNIPLSDFTGKRVGLLIGSDSAKAIEDKIPGVKLRFFDAPGYVLPALRSGRIDAFYCAEPTAVNIIQTNGDLAYIPDYVSITRHTTMFPKTAKGRKLCAEYADFLKTLSDDGTIDMLAEKWITGTDDSRQVTEDYSHLPATNGTLTLSVTEGLMPFVFMKDKRIQGYDIDLAVLFCKHKGCGLKIEITNHNGVLSSLNTGKCDFSYSVQWTKERDNTVLFSPVPNAITGSVLLVMRPLDYGLPSVNMTLSNFARKKIGVVTGTNNAIIVKEKIPSANLVYYESPADTLMALKQGKIDALSCGSAASVFLMRENDGLARVSEPVRKNYHFVAFVSSDKGRNLRNEYGEFLKTLWSDGTIKKLYDKWIWSYNESTKTEDYSRLPSAKGTLKMAADPAMVPFVFSKNNRIMGYDIDLAVMFCKARGYGLELVPMSHSGVIASLASGKCDFSYSIEYTDERAKSILFSEVPNVEADNILVVLKPAVNMNLSELNGKIIGVTVGTNHDSLVSSKIPGALIQHFSDTADMLAALKTGKIDAFANTLPTAEHILHENKELAYLPEHLSDTDYFTCFADSDEGRKLCAEYSEFVKNLWDKGVISQLTDKWITSENDSLRVTEDYSKLPAVNGTLTMAADSGFIPFSYVKDNRITGYDVDIAIMFCKEKGYGLEVLPMSFAGVLASLKAGKSDFTSSVIKTPERAESMIFSSVPVADSANVIVVMKPSERIKPTPVKISRAENKAPNENQPSFWEDVASSFRKTFIREERWRLFAEGIMNTMIITVSSIFCGMLLGFIAFMFCRTGSRVANVITKFSVWLIKGTPIVVLLMILYYVIFGHVNISGIVVAIIAFTLTFGTSVYRMLTFGTGAVDRGQTEAAYALGFTDMQTFFTVILPQAALHFMPSFKEEVTMLIKSTSVVGYIAVQDLTKMGDIVRSRTYEAFFPLIAVAVIYFVLAGMLNIIVNIIHVRITPSKRKPEDILRGIDTRGNDSHD